MAVRDFSRKQKLWLYRTIWSVATKSDIQSLEKNDRMVVKTGLADVFRKVWGAGVEKLNQDEDSDPREILHKLKKKLILLRGEANEYYEDLKDIIPNLEREIAKRLEEQGVSPDIIEKNIHETTRGILKVAVKEAGIQNIPVSQVLKDILGNFMVATSDSGHVSFKRKKEDEFSEDEEDDNDEDHYASNNN